MLLAPSFGLFEVEFTSIGIGTGLIDFLGVLIVGTGILLVTTAGSSRVIGALGQRVVASGYVDVDPFSRD